jgi:hypothetical protein
MVVLEHLDRQSNSLFWPMIHSYRKPSTENTHSQTNATGALRTQTGVRNYLGASAETTEGAVT